MNDLYRTITVVPGDGVLLIVYTWFCGFRVERSHSRGDKSHVSAVQCAVSERGEDLWVRSFEGGHHGESDRVQRGQCSEVCSSAHDNKEEKKNR